MVSVTKTVFQFFINITRSFLQTDWSYICFALKQLFLGNGKFRSEIVVVEVFSRGEKGHFRWWLLYIARHFCKRYERVVVLSNDITANMRYWESEGVDCPENLEWREYHLQGRKVLDCYELCSICGLDPNKSAVFFLWAEDLLPFTIIRKRFIPWGSLASLSWAQRGSKHSKLHFRIIELLEQQKECKCVVQADQFIAGVHGKNIWVPDVENVIPLQDESPLVSSVCSHVAGSFSVGAFGFLTGERCINGMDALSRKYPDIKLVLVGSLVKKTLTDTVITKIETCSEILLIDSFIETENELNSLIQSVDSVFVDSTGYQLQSGIIMKALAFGKFIITTPGNSWTCDMITEYGIGVIVKEGHCDIEDAWRTWKEEGGPARNVQVFESLTNDKVQDGCFDAIKNALAG